MRFLFRFFPSLEDFLCSIEVGLWHFRVGRKVVRVIWATAVNPYSESSLLVWLEACSSVRNSFFYLADLTSFLCFSWKHICLRSCSFFHLVELNSMHCFQLEVRQHFLSSFLLNWNHCFLAARSLFVHKHFFSPILVNWFICFFQPEVCSSVNLMNWVHCLLHLEACSSVAFLSASRLFPWEFLFFHFIELNSLLFFS